MKQSRAIKDRRTNLAKRLRWRTGIQVAPIFLLGGLMLSFGPAFADLMPFFPYTGSNWYYHLDTPPGATPGQFQVLAPLNSDVYTVVDGINQPSQGHHLIYQIVNNGSSTKTIKALVKIKLAGTFTWNYFPQFEQSLSPGQASAPVIQKYDERILFPLFVDTGTLKFKVTNKNVFGPSIGYGLFLAEDPPCGLEAGPECDPDSPLTDTLPPGFEEAADLVVEIQAEQLLTRVPVLTSLGACLLVLGFVIAAGFVLSRAY